MSSLGVKVTILLAWTSSLLLCLTMVACSGEPSPHEAWEETYLSAAEADRVPDNVARAIQNSTEEDRRSDASLSCAALFTLEPGLQETRSVAWRDARSFVRDPGAADVVVVANYATMMSPNVCFEDDEIKKRAFGDSPFTMEPLPEP